MQGSCGSCFLYEEGIIWKQVLQQYFRVNSTRKSQHWLNTNAIAACFSPFHMNEQKQP